MELQCTFESYNNYYRCRIENYILNTNGFKLTGEHSVGKTDNDVDFVEFYDCNIGKVPQGLTRLFKNLKSLKIYESNLKEISSNDLIEYENLEILSFIKNELEFLPNDLFKNFKNLKSISFKENHLKIIGHEILDELDKLEIVDLRKNSNYDIRYSIHENTMTIEDFKCKIFDAYLEKEPEYNRIFPRLHHGNIGKDLENLIKTDDFKDIKIRVGLQEVSAHRLVLAARSSFFRKFFKNNSVPVFFENEVKFENVKIILDFIYNGNLPEGEVDYDNLLTGAKKYEIKFLKYLAIGKIQSSRYRI